MNTEFRSYGTIAYGAAVFRRIVYGSTISFATTGRVKVVNGPGLVVSVAGRSIENATSSAVSSEPSLNRTPLRRRNSQVFGSTGRHDSATPGTSRTFSSTCVSASKMCQATLLFGVMLTKCGSIEVTSADMPMRRSAAPAVAQPTSKAAASPRTSADESRASGRSAFIGARRAPLLRLEQERERVLVDPRRVSDPFSRRPGVDLVVERDDAELGHRDPHRLLDLLLAALVVDGGERAVEEVVHLLVAVAAPRELAPALFR